MDSLEVLVMRQYPELYKKLGSQTANPAWYELHNLLDWESPTVAKLREEKEDLLDEIRELKDKLQDLQDELDDKYSEEDLDMLGE